MENPYQSPRWVEDSTEQMPPLQAMTGGPMVNQVRVICILMWVQGALELLMAVFIVGMGVFMGIMMSTAIAENPDLGGNGGPPPAALAWFMGGFYIAWSLPAFLAGGLHIYAGLRNFRFRNRTLGIVALSLGLASALTMYCAPTTIGLAIYGLIVYLSPEVKAAFGMGEQGYSGDEVLAAFVRLR